MLAKYHSVIFVHGCFWHGHECALFKWPKTRVDYWREKIVRNRFIDKRSTDMLLASGWRVAVIWECALRQRSNEDESLLSSIETWLRGEEKYFEA